MPAGPAKWRWNGSYVLSEAISLAAFHRAGSTDSGSRSRSEHRKARDARRPKTPRDRNRDVAGNRLRSGNERALGAAKLRLDRWDRRSVSGTDAAGCPKGSVAPSLMERPARNYRATGSNRAATAS